MRRTVTGTTALHRFIKHVWAIAALALLSACGGNGTDGSYAGDNVNSTCGNGVVEGAGTSRSNVFAVGDYGCVLRFTGHLPAPVTPDG